MKTVAQGVRAYHNKDNALIIITHNAKILEGLHVDYVHVLGDAHIVRTGAGSLVNEIIEDAAANDNLTREQLNLIHTYMRFGEDGLTIGKAGNPLTFRVVNDRLAFYMNDTEVAYLSDNKLYVTQAEILARLQIGKFAYEPQSNGNLSVIYTG